LRYRGTRAGRSVKYRLLASLAAHRSAITGSSTQPLQPVGSDYSSPIPTHWGYRPPPPTTTATARVSVLQPVCRAASSATVKVGSVNAGSIGNKFTSVASWIADNQLSVAAVVETWHDSPDDPHLIACAPPTHRYLERARPREGSKATFSNTNHGGISLFFNKAITGRITKLPAYKSFEVLACYLQGSLLTALVVTLYRPGSAKVTEKFFDELSDLLEHTVIYAAPLLIFGDFNLHLDDVYLAHTIQFNDILAAHDLIQHVKQSTHKNGHLLDIFITRSDVTVTSTSIGQPMSDHSPIVAQLDLQTQSSLEKTRITCQDWRAFNFDNFADDLELSKLVSGPPTDTDQLFACYDDTLEALLDKHTPFVTKKLKSRHTAPWYDASCRAIKAKSRRFEAIYRKTRTSAAHATWRIQLNNQRLFYQHKFTDYWSQTIEACRSDTKALWSKLSLLLKPPPLPTSSSHTPDMFANFNKSKVDTIRSKTSAAPPPKIEYRSIPPMKEFDPVTDDEILKILHTSPAKHCSLDPVPTWLVKRLADLFAPIYARLCNSSLASGVVPVAHKHAIVRPRLKKPCLDSTDLASYRPISNLSFLSKTVERTVAARFLKHADDYNLLPARQSAYRAHYSTETAVVSVHNDLVRAIDDGNVSILVLLDLSAAFDTVDHQTLVEVLNKRFGIDGTVLTWYRSYLADRTQTYLVGDKRSVTSSLTYGVPQGSVLGPQEFIAYTEDIATRLACRGVKHHLFADDKQAYAHTTVDKIATATSSLEKCVADVADWCASRRLQLNAAKTEIAWFGSRTNLRNIAENEARCLQIGADVIKPVDVVRDLGVLLDSELSMKQHVAKITIMCFFHLRRLRQVRRSLGPDVTQRLVSAFVLSRLDYCNAVLAGLPASTISPLQRVQNAAARLVFNLKPRDSVTGAMKHMHWLPIRYRIKYKLCLLMHAVVNHRCPAYMSDMMTMTTDIVGRAHLRSASAGDFDVPRTRTVFAERAFSVAGPRQWNKLPAELRSLSDIDHFKGQLKARFYRKAYY
jgi:hypothetical protein